MFSRRYTLQGVSAARLYREVDVFWEELQRNVALQRQVQEAGIDVNEFKGRARADAILLRPTEAHIGVETSVAIAVTFAPAINHVTKSLWDKIALPWLQKRVGLGAIRPLPRPKKGDKKKPGKSSKKKQ